MPAGDSAASVQGRGAEAQAGEWGISTHSGLADRNLTPWTVSRRQVLDWKLVEESGGVRLRCVQFSQLCTLAPVPNSLRARRTWTAKDAAAGQMLAARVQEVAADEGVCTHA